MKTSTDITEKLKELAAMLSDDAVKTSADVLQDELQSRAAVSTSETLDRVLIATSTINITEIRPSATRCW